MSDKTSGLDQLSVSDQAIYDYLDDMFREPDQLANSGLELRRSRSSEQISPELRTSDVESKELQSNQVNSAIGAPLLQAVPKPIAEPARLHVNPNIMTLQAFKELPPESLIPSPIVVPLPANEVLPPEDDTAQEKESPADTTLLKEKKAEPKTKPIASESLKPEPVKPEPINPEPVKPKVKPAPQTIEKPHVTSRNMPVEKHVEMERVDSKVDPRDIEKESVKAVEAHLPPVEEGWCDNGRPDWAQERFECLIFCVGGLKLAVPLVTLGAIHQIDRKFNQLPGQDDWFIGILRTPTGNLKVIDTALCVMPERYQPKDSENLKFVISLHGYEWGISCHDVANSVTLEPEEVRWRTQRGKRPWLAGTVIDHMCALIEPAGFHRVIEKVEK